MRHPTTALRIAFLVVTAGLAVPLLSVFDLPSASAPAHRTVTASAWVTALYWCIAAMLLMADLEAHAARAWWTAGCAFAWLHTAIAFHAVHGWSHAAAFEHTERVGGFGSGVFINYSFLVIWAFDVAWSWLAPRAYERRPRWLSWSIHGFLAFVVLNATVVFASGPLRWVAAAAFALLTWEAIRQRRSPNEETRHDCRVS